MQHRSVKGDAIPASKLARMLGPKAAPALIQVAALGAERLANEGGKAAEDLLTHGVVPLLVWQLGSMLEGSQAKGATQVARALVAVTGAGAAFQSAVCEANGIETLLYALEQDGPSISDAAALAAAALGNLTANNNDTKERIRHDGWPLWP